MTAGKAVGKPGTTVGSASDASRSFGSGDVRNLRRIHIEPGQTGIDDAEAPLKVAVALDVETTGLFPRLATRYRRM